MPARVLGLPSEGLDQALLMALVARVVKLSAGFKVGASWTSQQAREAILGLLRSFGCPLWWIVRALDQAERHPRAKVGNKPVESWGFIRQTVSNWSRGDGTPGSPPGSKSGAPPGPPCPGAVSSGEGNPSRSPPRPAAGVLECRDRRTVGRRASGSDRRAGGDAGQPVVVTAAETGRDAPVQAIAGAEPAGGPTGRVVSGKDRHLEPSPVRPSRRSVDLAAQESARRVEFPGSPALPYPRAAVPARPQAGGPSGRRGGARVGTGGVSRPVVDLEAIAADLDDVSGEVSVDQGLDDLRLVDAFLDRGGASLWSALRRGPRRYVSVREQGTW